MDNYYPPSQPQAPVSQFPQTGSGGGAPGGGRKGIFAVGILVIAAVLIGGGYYYWKTQVDRTYEFQGGQYAEEGEIAKGFPPELIPERNLQIIESFHRDNEDGSKLDVAAYQVNKDIAASISPFKPMLQANGWAVEREADAAQAVTSIFAKKGSEELVVTFAKLAEGSTQVTVARTAWK